MIVNTAKEYRKWGKDKDVRPDVDEKSHVNYRGSALTNPPEHRFCLQRIQPRLKQTFAAPYNRCDCIVDHLTAWAHFDKIFNNK